MTSFADFCYDLAKRQIYENKIINNNIIDAFPVNIFIQKLQINKI